VTLWQRIALRIGAHRFARAFGLYPPYFCSGIRVTHADRGLREIEVELRLRPWNRNYVGTHFGGSLYSMCDPFYMLMVMENLGPGYIVWDKSATIDFLKPGRGRVRARFELTDDQLAGIRQDLDRDGKSYPNFEVTVRNEAGEAVARVGKLLSIRKRQDRRPA